MSATLQGKTALITGANQGIGLALAIALAREGVTLVLLNRTTGKLQDLEDAVPKVQYTEHSVDVGNNDRVLKVVEGLTNAHKRIDILVNNAGIALQGGKNFWEQDLSAVQQTLNTNIYGTVNVTHAVLKNFLIPQKAGTILNISSVTGLETPPPGFGEVIYHSTKQFLEGFSNALRNETVNTNIRVLVLRPGFVKTNFHYQRMNRDEQSFQGVFEGTEELVPADIADAGLWMLKSPERISVKALDMVPTAQRALSVVDREWNERQKELL